MEKLALKARNYYILGRIAEKMGMYPESATNYFKALAALNDFMLKKIGLKPKDHSERFVLLRQHYPHLYEITDKLFLVYRRTYSEEIAKEELLLVRRKIEVVFKYAGTDIPTEEEIRKKAEEISA